jgi:hypothetical protein
MEPIEDGMAMLVLNIDEKLYDKLVIMSKALGTNPDRVGEIVLSAALNDCSWSLDEVEKAVNESQKKEEKD